MKPITKRTLDGICGELAAHGWGDAELAELVDSKLGIITGFQDLLSQLEVLRIIDLGAVGPAQSVFKRRSD